MLIKSLCKTCIYKRESSYTWLSIKVESEIMSRISVVYITLEAARILANLLPVSVNHQLVVVYLLL